MVIQVVRVVASLGAVPDSIAARIQFHNLDTTTRVVEISSGCPVYPIAYSEDPATGGTTVWHEANNRGCPDVAREITLAPGASEAVTHVVSRRVADGAGELIPAGPIFLAAHIGMAGRPVLRLGEMHARPH